MTLHKDMQLCHRLRIIRGAYRRIVTQMLMRTAEFIEAGNPSDAEITIGRVEEHRRRIQLLDGQIQELMIMDEESLAQNMVSSYDLLSNTRKQIRMLQTYTTRDYYSLSDAIMSMQLPTILVDPTPQPTAQMMTKATTTDAKPEEPTPLSANPSAVHNIIEVASESICERPSITGPTKAAISETTSSIITTQDTNDETTTPLDGETMHCETHLAETHVYNEYNSQTQKVTECSQVTATAQESSCQLIATPGNQIMDENSKINMNNILLIASMAYPLLISNVSVQLRSNCYKPYGLHSALTTCFNQRLMDVT